MFQCFVDLTARRWRSRRTRYRSGTLQPSITFTHFWRLFKIFATFVRFFAIFHKFLGISWNWNWNWSSGCSRVGILQDFWDSSKDYFGILWHSFGFLKDFWRLFQIFGRFWGFLGIFDDVLRFFRIFGILGRILWDSVGFLKIVSDFW